MSVFFLNRKNSFSSFGQTAEVNRSQPFNITGSTNLNDVIWQKQIRKEKRKKNKRMARKRMKKRKIFRHLRKNVVYLLSTFVGLLI